MHPTAGSSPSIWKRQIQVRNLVNLIARPRLTISFPRLVRFWTPLLFLAAMIALPILAWSGYNRHLLAMAIDLQEGLTQPRNVTRAMELFERLHERGYSEGTQRLAICLINGDGGRSDQKRGLELLENSIARGHAKSMITLAESMLYALDDHRDIPRAIKLLKQAESLGAARASFLLGWCREEDRGGQRSGSTAEEYYARARKKGTGEDLLHIAQFWQGRGDLRRAYEWWLLAAQRGDATAMCNVGTCLSEGEGATLDLDAARGWFERAVRAGDPRGVASCNLGQMLSYGRGGPADPKRAAALFRQSAERGFVPAMYNLAHCLLNGVGTKADSAEAMKWMTEAAAGGDEDAERYMRQRRGGR